MTSPSAFPQRLSDAEREQAVSTLRAHLEAGRLSYQEFDERSDAARAARTASDVAPLFADLPAPHPLYVTTTTPTWNTYPGASSPPVSGTVLPPEPGAPGQIPTYSGTLEPRPQPALPSQTERMLGTLQKVIWPVAIMLFLFGGTGIWPIIVAIVVSSVLGGTRGQRRRRQPPPY